MIRKQVMAVGGVNSQGSQRSKILTDTKMKNDRLQSLQESKKMENKNNISPSVSNSGSLKNRNKQIWVSPRPLRISQDGHNYGRFRGQVDDLGRRSSPEQVYEFVKGIVEKSEREGLSNTERFMLKGYVQIYIQEAVNFNDVRDMGQLSVYRVRLEWMKICRIWELMGIRERICNVRRDGEKKERVGKSFQVLEQLMGGVQRNKGKLEGVWKLMKKLYFDIIS